MAVPSSRLETARSRGDNGLETRPRATPPPHAAWPRCRLRCTGRCRPADARRAPPRTGRALDPPPAPVHARRTDLLRPAREPRPQRPRLAGVHRLRPNRYEVAAGAPAARDWGDPRTSHSRPAPCAIARAGDPDLEAGRRRRVVLRFADAELVASHPEVGPDALIVVDSYLDLAARFDALPPHHETRIEMKTVLGGTPAQQPAAYRSRSPSHHLAGLADAIRHGTHLVVVWSTSAGERTSSTVPRARGSRTPSARPARGSPRPTRDRYVTKLPHAHALWDRGQGCSARRIAPTGKPLDAHVMTFRPARRRAAAPRDSCC